MISKVLRKGGVSSNNRTVFPREAKDVTIVEEWTTGTGATGFELTRTKIDVGTIEIGTERTTIVPTMTDLARVEIDLTVVV